MAYSVLIIGGGTHTAELAALLETEGFKEIYQANNGPAAIEEARRRRPEVILLDIEMPGEDSISIARDILVERPAPIVVHAAYSQFERVKEANDMGVSAHLFRPVTRETLLSSIEVGMARFRQCQTLHAELGECKEVLRVRKLVERAKGILMKRKSMTEEEAFLKIQKLSRDNNIAMEKVAESIITASEVI